MRYLGIDYGTKKIGVALSDEGGTFAFPYETLANDEKLFRHLREIVEKEHVERVVVGESVTFAGEKNLLMGDIGRFIAALEKQCSVLAVLQSEAFSSAEAARFAPKGKTHDDAAAAAIILQRFLDSTSHNKQ
jgi:putative Holliday junction resolvase